MPNHVYEPLGPYEQSICRVEQQLSDGGHPQVALRIYHVLPNGEEEQASPVALMTTDEARRLGEDLLRFVEAHEPP